MKPSDILAMLPRLRDAIRSGQVPHDLQPALAETVDHFERSVSARILVIEQARKIRSERVRFAILEALDHFSKTRPNLSERELMALARRRAGRGLPHEPCARTVRLVFSDISSHKCDEKK